MSRAHRPQGRQRRHKFADRRRLYKKLCKRASALLIRWQPKLAGESFASNRHEPPAWLGAFADPLPGTCGFGRMSGYFEPEWEDQSAFSLLRESLYLHILESCPTSGDLRLPDDAPDFNNWRSIMAAAEQIVAAIEMERRQG